MNTSNVVLKATVKSRHGGSFLKPVPWKLKRVAMQVSGHKTRSVFDRYNITSEQDLDDAMVKLERYRETATVQLHPAPERDVISGKVRNELS